MTYKNAGSKTTPRRRLTVPTATTTAGAILSPIIWRSRVKERPKTWAKYAKPKTWRSSRAITKNSQGSAAS